jgi:hypothetical protein
LESLLLLRVAKNISFAGGGLNGSPSRPPNNNVPINGDTTDDNLAEGRIGVDGVGGDTGDANASHLRRALVSSLSPSSSLD